MFYFILFLSVTCDIFASTIYSTVLNNMPLPNRGYFTIECWTKHIHWEIDRPVSTTMGHCNECVKF